MEATQCCRKVSNYGCGLLGRRSQVEGDSEKSRRSLEGMRQTPDAPETRANMFPGGGCEEASNGFLAAAEVAFQENQSPNKGDLIEIGAPEGTQDKNQAAAEGGIRVELGVAADGFWE